MMNRSNLDDDKRIARKRTSTNIVIVPVKSTVNIHENRTTYVDLKGSSVQNAFIPVQSSQLPDLSGVSYVNPHYASDDDVDDSNEQEIQLIDNENDQKPILLMFPKLKDADIQSEESTTVVTRKLVGQKADFSHIIPHGGKKITLDKTLQPLPEMQEDQEEKQISFGPGDANEFLTNKEISESESEHYDVQSNGNEVKSKNKQKIRKIVLNNTQSSESDVNLPPKPAKHRKVYKQTSSEDNFGDDEMEQEPKVKSKKDR